MELLKEHPKKTLIFVETKLQAKLLETKLNENDFKAISIHGDKSQAQRDFALKSFRTGTIPILVATDVASRGIDVKDVSHVINYDMPKDIESYVHRIGRTGRVGHQGLATSFITKASASLRRELIQVLKDSKQEIPDWLRRLQFEEKNKKLDRMFANRTRGNQHHKRNVYKEWNEQWKTERY
jgi:ATP-dependent RNA helicase DDX3X